MPTHLFIGGPEHRKLHSVTPEAFEMRFPMTVIDRPMFDPDHVTSHVRFRGEYYTRKTVARDTKTVNVLQYGVMREAKITDRVDVFVHESVDENWLKKFIETEVLPKP